MEWFNSLFGSGMGGGGYDTSMTGGGSPFPSPMGGGEGDKLGQLLRGVKAPVAPETQRLGLPGNAPAPRAPTPIKGGDLLALLQMSNMGGGATAKTNYDLPSTLGMALRGR